MSRIGTPPAIRRQLLRPIELCLWPGLVATCVATTIASWFRPAPALLWLAGCLSLLSLALLLFDLRARLPTQNLLAIATILIVAERSLLSSAILQNQGTHSLARWVAAAAMAAAGLGAWETARIIADPFRSPARYTIFLLGLALLLFALFTVACALMISPRPAYLRLCLFAGGSAVALLACTPLLISKQTTSMPLNLKPFFVWLLLNVAAANGAIAHHLWPAARLLCLNLLLPAAVVFLNRRPHRSGASFFPRQG